MLTRNKFMKRYYKLDKLNKILKIYEPTKSSFKLKQSYDLTQYHVKVDD